MSVRGKDGIVDWHEACADVCGSGGVLRLAEKLGTRLSGTK